jgi:predicted LPLAT superfamily acyltransferase
MLWSYRLFGRRVFSWLLYLVIGYFFITDRRARDASHEFLSRIYEDPRGRTALGTRPGWRHSFKHFFCFGDAILDKLSAWTDGFDERQIVYENRAIFDSLLKSQQGGLLIASHLGNMEVCRALAEHTAGLKLNVLVHTKHATNFNKLLARLNPNSSVALIQATEVDLGTAIMLRQCIERGEFVVIVGDRIPVTGSTRIGKAEFLGRQAQFPHGPYILGALLECPVQLIFCLKRKSRFHIIFEPFAESIVLPRRDRQQVLDQLTLRLAGRLSHHCTVAPFEWFNFFDFWNHTTEPKKPNSVANC